MPGGRSSTKNSGKPARQLPFSEALLHSKTSSPCPGGSTACPAPKHVGLSSGVHHGSYPPGDLGGRSQAGGDGQCNGLINGGNKIHLSGYCRLPVHVMGLEQRVAMVEAHASTSWDPDQELLYLRRKMTDLEDRSRRDNVRFLGFPDTIEGEDMH
ncbi:hypothetical protein NDU88_003895 [Pleurodeles waltl]|uniref:Uncharacterized protein n=1 Tax=Pleurodeles waltl TaxID=8319 RepID=A0AAV7VH37_PLEWA|nr:hypothetical protein NDU88_003895 [Pleurodeles waltl]